VVDLGDLAPTLRPGSNSVNFMADQAKGGYARPLSPHLQVYRWPVTMATSITHRVTGSALAAGTLLVAWWLIAAASGSEAYDTFSMVARSPLGLLVLLGFVWSLAFHLLNGVRHLAWDSGFGFNVKTAERTGVLVYALSIVIAVGVFAYAFAAKGLSL
jgi:succinate dehydrogenase / fumarate reductase, cytochrome b subunit